MCIPIYCDNCSVPFEQTAFGGERVDAKLKDGYEDEDEDGIEGLHLVRFDCHCPQLPVHKDSLQRPAGTLGGETGGREE